ncbi:MAG: FHA domain-containing protein [Nitrospinae bacterium]|nr:FHA domain-containing protein [Nitrospinota bacterium]
MGKESFRDIFGDPKFREARLASRKIYGLLSEASEKRKLYEELERDYSARLEQMAASWEKRETQISLTPAQAGELIEELKGSLNEACERVKHLRREVRLNRLRFKSKEYGAGYFTEKRDELRRALEVELADVSWLKEGMAMLRKAGSWRVDDTAIEVMDGAPTDPAHKRMPLDMEPEAGSYKGGTERKKEMGGAVKEAESAGGAGQPGKGVEKTPDETGEHRKAPDFNPDQTMAISEAMVGSAPGRLLEPALMVRKKDGVERITLGRKDISVGNIRNPENDVSLYDTQVSRHHGKIVYDNVTRSWFYLDVGSTNGSELNGKPLAPNDPALIKNNDIIKVGDTEIMVYLP